jgi:hypothetical protein
MPEAFDWLKPSPLWDGPEEMKRAEFFRPQVLEFASDDFIQEFQTAAAAPRPSALRQVLVSPGPAGPPRLFQPIHGRFYLACASLACRLPGFPDREVRRGEGERVFFLLRKLAGGIEYGWVAAGPAKGWRPLDERATRVLDGEEPLAAFPVAAGNDRTLYAAYIPVASRETYLAPPAASPIDSGDPRPHELAGVLDGLRTLLGGAEREPLRASSLILLELSLFLERHAPLVHPALPDGAPAPVDPAAAGLVTYLKGKASNVAPGVTLARAIADAGARRDELGRLAPEASPPVSPLPHDLRDFNLGADVGSGAFERAIAAGLAPRDPSAPAAVEVGKFARQSGDRYAVRGVYRRPQCDPVQDWVGRPSEPFELAPLYDPDAPVRQIRIGLPEDVSVAGLRKFAKGVAFSVSKQLQEQLNRVSPDMLKGDPPGPFQPDLGFICTLSIPIITICAFILLMIIVNILNLIFRWLPFFQICLPLKPSARP